MNSYLTYKYLIEPDKAQRERIDAILKDVNFVEKLFIKDYANVDRNYFRVTDIVDRYKKQYPNLYDSDSSALVNTIFKMTDLKKQNKLNGEEIKRSYSYKTTFLKSDKSVRLGEKNIYLPRVGFVKMKMHRKIPDDYVYMNCTVSKERHRLYSVSIHVKIEHENNHKIDKNKIIGLDYSNKYFIVDDNGNKYDGIHYFRDIENKINRFQSYLTHYKKGSRNYYKTKQRISGFYIKHRNQRRDYLHKLSTQLVNEYDVIAVESLNMQEIAQHGNLGKSTYDNAYAMFLDMLEYKAKLKGKLLIKVDKWYPSSKMCHKCGSINEKLIMSTREWTCVDCGTKHDRDVNAAINIKNEALRLLP